MEKKWVLARQTEAEAEALSAKLRISPMIADILLRRGLHEAKELNEFLAPDSCQPFYNPFELQDMDRAIERICAALQKQEKIVVYGDYDVDGMTATALLVRQLRRLGGKADYYVPLRKTEGYGLHDETLAKIYEAGVDLIITVDCGITALAEVAGYREKIDFIITDHHLTVEELPQAIAAIDPKRIDDNYPDKNIAGVGVAFKLCQALWQAMGYGSFDSFTEDLELVALGTIADMVPLLRENRKFASMGLKRLTTTKIVGLQQLVVIAGLQEKEKIDSSDVGFRLAPRFNAVGRMDNAKKGIQLLLTDDSEQALELAQFLQKENELRQAATKEIFALADQQVKQNCFEQAPALVLSGEGWHEGIVGLVASRLVEKYYLPTIVIGVSDGKGKGSCRSIEGLHMRKALDYCRDSLERFGGHEMAAGLTVQESKIMSLREKFCEYAAANLTAEDYICKQRIEFIASTPADVTLNTLEDLTVLEPFGKDNEQPLFACFNVKAGNIRKSRDGVHLFFTAGPNTNIVGWHMADKMPLLQSQAVDIVFRPAVNEFRGTKSVQLVLQDIRPARTLNRNTLANLYRVLVKCARDGKAFTNEEAAACGCTDEEFQTVKTVFLELEFMQEKDGVCQLLPTQGKKQLYASQKYCEYLA